MMRLKLLLAALGVGALVSAAYDPTRSRQDRLKVCVTRLYEVECTRCGIIDSRRTRAQAEEAARLHRQAHRDGIHP